MKYYFSLLLITFSLFSCQEEFIEANTANRGEDYLPLQNGKSITYQYDSLIIYNKGLTKLNVSGFFKEEIGKQISKTASETKFELLRYWKKKLSDQWQLVEVESIIKSNSQIIATEENLPFIRLVFPVKKDAIWQGNSLFNDDIVIKFYGEDLKMYSNWDYKIVAVGKKFNFNNKAFEDCAEILETDKTTSLTKRYSRAVYAKGIGLLEREMYIYNTQKPQTGQPWENYAEEGYNIKMKYLEHN
jgi:hypothetical protein